MTWDIALYITGPAIMTFVAGWFLRNGLEKPPAQRRTRVGAGLLLMALTPVLLVISTRVLSDLAFMAYIPTVGVVLTGLMVGVWLLVYLPRETRASGAVVGLAYPALVYGAVFLSSIVSAG